MATNLTNIGFHAQNGGELEQLAKTCFDNGKPARCSQGCYIQWAPGLGIELWAQLNSKDELIGLNPHFFGKTRASVGLLSRVARSGYPMDGGFRGLAQPYGCEPIQGAFEFVFDTPDFLLWESLALPAIRSVQLTAFVQQCSIFENEEDYRGRAAKHGHKIPPDALLPLGLLDKNRQPLSEPLASAMVCGTIADSALLCNPVTKKDLWWLKIRCCAGEMDVVSDPELLPRGARNGGVLQCTAWLSGRLAD